MCDKKLLLFFVMVSFFAFNETKVRPKREPKSYIVGCFYTNWAQYRPDKGKFIPDYYSPGLCSHIYFAFAKMNENFTISPYEWNDLSQIGIKGMYERINSWKRNQSDLKTLLSFGGATFSQSGKKLLKMMTSTKQNRKIFIKSAMDFVQKYNFDGLDIDWDFPDAEDKNNFADLLTELSSKFHQKGLLVTVAVSASVFIIDSVYDVQVLNAMDIVNIMTYDMHGGWDKMTGFHSPLFDNHGDQLSVSSAADYWLKQGLSKKITCIGFPTFGRGWTLTDPTKHGVGANGSVSIPGKYTKEAGFLAYYEICNMVNNGGQRYFDNDQKAPYVVYGNQWYGYDDEESFKLKAAWLRDQDYGGAFVWTMDMDDFNGFCKPGSRFPLLNVLKKELLL